jgi:hypothetical protein
MPATHHDAELILKIYDLRRESEMRKARNFVGMEFWPNNFEELQKAVFNMGSDANRYFRQVISFWEMAASLVVHGSINAELFSESSISGEMFFVYAKLKPFLPQIRETMGSPEFLANSEKIILGTEANKKKLEAFEKRIAMLKERIKAQKAAAA